MVGPSTTSTPLRRASTAAAAPYRRAMAGSQDEARAVAEGRFSDGSRSSHVSPRTPEGPSDTRMRRSPMRSSGQVVQKSRPVSSWTFSSRESAARASPSWVSGGAAGFVMGPFSSRVGGGGCDAEPSATG